MTDDGRTERDNRVTEARIEGESERAMRNAGWSGNIEVSEDPGMEEAAPFLGPLSVKVSEVIVEEAKQWPTDEAELDKVILILKGRGRGFKKVNTPNALICGMVGVSGEAPSPDDMLDTFTGAIQQVIKGTNYQDPFARAAVVEQVDQELAEVLRVVAAKNSEALETFWGRLRHRFGIGAKKREQELLVAINEWARAYRHIQRTGGLPSSETEYDGLDAISKADFEAK